MPRSSARSIHRATAARDATTDQRRRLKLATYVAALSLAAHPSAQALDLEGSDGIITETIASRERLRDYDNIKKYGAERVADRERKYAMPEGIRAGNSYVFPALGANVVFDDNVFQSDLEKHSDIRTELTPSVRLRSALPRHQLDLSLDGKIVSYLERSDLDYANVRAKLDGALHFDHAHTLSASILSSLEHEELGEITTDKSAVEPIAVFHNWAGVGITRDVGRLYGTLMATLESWNFDDVRSRGNAILDQDARDTTEIAAAVRLGYRFSPGYELVAKLRALRDYNRGDGTTDRDGDGYEAMAGLAFETSPLLRWRLLGGYGIRHFETAGIADIGTGILEAQVQWLPTQYLTFKGTATRQIIAADTVNDAGRVETRLAGHLDYEVWHNLVLNIGLEYQNAEFVGVLRNDETVSGKVGLDYYANKNWLFTIGYEHAIRESTDAASDMTRNRVSIGAKLRF